MNTLERILSIFLLGYLTSRIAYANYEFLSDPAVRTLLNPGSLFGFILTVDIVVVYIWWTVVFDTPD